MLQLKAARESQCLALTLGNMYNGKSIRVLSLTLREENTFIPGLNFRKGQYKGTSRIMMKHNVFYISTLYSGPGTLGG